MSQVVACSIVIFVLSSYLRGFYGETKGYRISDNIDIGYIRPTVAPKPEKRIKAPEATKPNKLYEECSDALVSLGYKRSAAKERVKQVFSSHKVSKVEEFLLLAFNKNE